ncbi:hypothetical protein PI124_g1625 [Phytophthora idaei]|nr:hypothetical protein PI125_g1491 [Phytophthora idaei]KAG3253753.1 hypothetical protein PI124_g1625 [Phytophthora idaei]
MQIHDGKEKGMLAEELEEERRRVRHHLQNAQLRAEELETQIMNG